MVAVNQALTIQYGMLIAIFNYSQYLRKIRNYYSHFRSLNYRLFRNCGEMASSDVDAEIESASPCHQGSHSQVNNNQHAEFKNDYM